jgi:hypothetical protein
MSHCHKRLDPVKRRVKTMPRELHLESAANCCGEEGKELN